MRLCLSEMDMFTGEASLLNWGTNTLTVAIYLKGNGYAYRGTIFLRGMNTLTGKAIVLKGNGNTYRGGDCA